MGRCKAKKHGLLYKISVFGWPAVAVVLDQRHPVLQSYVANSQDCITPDSTPTDKAQEKKHGADRGAEAVGGT